MRLKIEYDKDTGAKIIDVEFEKDTTLSVQLGTGHIGIVSCDTKTKNITDPLKEKDKT